MTSKMPRRNMEVNVGGSIVGSAIGEHNRVEYTTIGAADDTTVERDQEGRHVGRPREGAVFVVHGRNIHARTELFAFLRAIGLVPLEWPHALALTNQGSPYIGEILDSAFNNAQAIVVLLTPDDIAFLRPDYADRPGDPQTQPAGQARPNVLFEAGMAMGRAPARTILVEFGTLRPFSDVAGRVAIHLQDTVACRQLLAERLRTTGCAVDLSGTDWHDAGDFTWSPDPG
jgi:predicted nucleotide-binding protein